MNDQILAFWKRLLSYTKKTWNINDYPLRYKKQKNDKSSDAESGIKEWSVQIINWWSLIGLGDTKSQAFDMLNDNFNSYKRNHEKLPRPGVIVPIEFAEGTKLEQLEDVAINFFPTILGYDFHGIFVSDQSSVFDFGIDEKELIEKINANYNLNLSELGDGNIVRLLQDIKARGRTI
jgi:hypothetical protein